MGSFEDHFDLAPHEDDVENVIDAEVVKETTSEISITNKESQLTKPDDFSIVKVEEVRENYEKSQAALAKNLSVGGKLLNQISDNLEDSNMEPGNQNRLYESAGTLMKALNDTAKTLVSLHQDAGSIFGDVSKVEINNTQNNVSAVGPEFLQQLADMAKIHNGISIDGSEVE